MAIGLLTLHLSIPDCHSLKQKRSRVQPIIARLHREFNIAAAETGRLDQHEEALIQCAALSTNNGEVQAFLQKVVDFTASHWPDIEILQYRIECV
ncbi:DUF503 domain-containing protein [Leptolinea tardivitalis]|uniref:DUF503 domain-containing protein n=1 Tax=Leptolinea tardivitalis TaxID=229920 RepID=A0A0P6WNX9_9CHLR|nr:DUF503 domain-containing protein [Leptolinea tardivitalis]KPL71743.1 hypothetical protein ADM99_09840 [Leptolinea tardivitalis]GAP20104.1 uncharacterized protein conserved in bacteria [Leptolinea tardivitalis]